VHGDIARLRIKADAGRVILRHEEASKDWVQKGRRRRGGGGDPREKAAVGKERLFTPPPLPQAVFTIRRPKGGKGGREGGRERGREGGEGEREGGREGGRAYPPPSRARSRSCSIDSK
jgi:hypothetical protein